MLEDFLTNFNLILYVDTTTWKNLIGYLAVDTKLLLTEEPTPPLRNDDNGCSRGRQELRK